MALVAFDIEAFGPIPGPNSMCQLGAVAYTHNRTFLGKFSVNIKDLDGSVRDKDTMEWWRTKNAANLKLVQENTVSPFTAMSRFRDWLLSLKRPVTLVAYPSGFDFMFVYWYWQRFLEEMPFFNFRCIDTKSYLSGVTGDQWGEGIEKYKSKEALPHCAVEDAEMQMQMFFRIQDARKGAVE